MNSERVRSPNRTASPIDETSGTAYVSDTANGRIAVYHGTPAHRLGVELTGTGLGAVSADAPPLESCGDEGPCVGYYAASTLVLKATPQVHSFIDGWTGCDDVSVDGNECTVEMTNADREVFPNFTRVQQTVSATTTGTGTGAVSDASALGAIQDCGDGGACSGPYDEGSADRIDRDAHRALHLHRLVRRLQQRIGALRAGGRRLAFGHRPLHRAARRQHQEGRRRGRRGGQRAGRHRLRSRLRRLLHRRGDGDALGRSLGALRPSPAGREPAAREPAVCEVEVGGATQTVTATFAHDLPSALTEPGATFVGQHVATVHGSVDPNGAAITHCVVEYGTGASYGAQSPCAPSALGDGEAFMPIGVNLSDLRPGTVYHYRVSASNVGGTAYGQDQTFRTLDDSCDTNEALCPPAKPVEEPKSRRCGKGRVLRKGHCVKKRRHHRSKRARRHRHATRGGRS